jgi:malic enzyme
VQAACGIADLITHAMVREGVTEEEAKSKIWMYDVHGLIVDVSIARIDRHSFTRHPCLNLTF